MPTRAVRTPPSPAAVLAARAEAPTSSVARACRLLRAMSDVRVTRLTDIAAAAGLDKATASRLLDSLMHDGFVVRDEASKRYALGPELLVLGAAALARFDPRPALRPSVLRLAGRFQDSVIVSLPSGIESLCVDVEEGTFPIRANYLTVGSRRPLGVGAGSLALLAWMPEAEREAALAAIGPLLKRHPNVSVALLKERIATARDRGHAMLLDVVVPGMGGIAVPVLDTNGRPVAALSIAALSERIGSREAALAQALRHERKLCEVAWVKAATPAPVLHRVR